ncbi:SprT-like domain-containing protein Spartan [Armadillidium nasatum]|uniref:SprT-like domain-containing protein Spartan n=1 Tax=Armadillidium nasatum TaxID=96803 RepID=A0A5N5SXM0_9CRUS|nr:SprT-like domain-containing protein Spartan [Armadillidium nasatum]
MAEQFRKFENVHLEDLLKKFNDKYFSGILNRRTSVSWSENMTLCTGKTYMNQRNGSRYCLIKLSKPILSQRPYNDVINTLLHEMIHAYLYLQKGIEGSNGHGEEFKSLMKYINEREGTHIKIYHSFRKEVDKFRVNIYKCSGPCRNKKPYYGILKRAISRPPGPEDHWWKKHEEECGGVFKKVDSNSSTEAPVPKRSSTKLIKPLHPYSGKYRKVVTSKLIYNKVIKHQHPDPGMYRKVEGNVDINYSSKVKKINIQKYIKNYFESTFEAVQSTNNNNNNNQNNQTSAFRRHLLSTVEKYVKRMQNSIKFQE